ncbi:NAD(P)-dependent oxidoreductase [Olivibacter sp. SDN3]|uniref:NAD(P)-dependent oxidoreductase n=1 Tax=Olivibacter sp. SDN3 TaxID=2764720 RepID=UPI0016513A54|nr:NAD(P)-binding domain-containing protein [Olivibacter sp. SDN3]QNL51019.1 NAD(P)-dependent oxidoreductase [Olivibacter sp. SDN3]
MNHSINGKNKVTLIGLGPMGQAIANVYLENGYRVTVWNRTASRAEKLVANGAILAPTVTDALQASDLVLLSLTDYAAMYDILDATDVLLADKVIVNLSSDTPQKTRAASVWLAERGASLIVGGIMVPADLVGKAGAYVFYSGLKSVFELHEGSLQLIGKPDYVGEDPGLAQLFYQAQLDIFLTSLSAYLHATALVGSAGISAKAFLPYAIEMFENLPAIGGLTEAADHIDMGVYPGDMANIIMMGATADHIVGASRSAGLNAGLPGAVKALYDRTIATGHGRDGWPSLIEAIKNPS